MWQCVLASCLDLKNWKITLKFCRKWKLNCFAVGWNGLALSGRSAFSWPSNKISGCSPSTPTTSAEGSSPTGSGSPPSASASATTCQSRSRRYGGPQVALKGPGPPYSGPFRVFCFFVLSCCNSRLKSQRYFNMNQQLVLFHDISCLKLHSPVTCFVLLSKGHFCCIMHAQLGTI